MRARWLAAALGFAGAALFASRGASQGTLSTQGYGYPAGGLSTRALATGGGVGEIDPLSTLNPAALTTWGRSGIYGQFGPEFRQVDVDGSIDKSTVIRFPVFSGAVNAGEQWVFGLSFSNLLDRTWSTQLNGYVYGVSDSTYYTQVYRSLGSITNVRLATAFRISNSVRVGVAGHFFTGQNSLSIGETFADSGYASFAQITVLNVSGLGISGGVAWSPIPMIGLGVSGMLGGVMRSRVNDTIASSARVPSRAGASLIFAGISGVAVAANVEWTQWSAMNGLAQSNILAVDAWDMGVGVEIRLPTAGAAELPLRLGFRKRTLPFQADAQTVKESLASLGFGIPLSGGRARLDLGVLRALRRANVPATENAWEFSVGILVRP